MKKIIILLVIISGLQFSAFSQGFASFRVKGELEQAKIKHVKNGASIIEVIVASDVDLKDLDYKYRLLSNCYLDDDLDFDFSEPKRVTVYKNDGSSKDWIIYVKRLVPASLPFELNFSKHNFSEWNSDVVGWAGIAIDKRKKTVIRFGNKGVSFWVAINQPAKRLTYKLTPVSRDKVSFDGVFIVETSQDGKDWETLTEFNSKHQFSETEVYKHELNKKVRFVRWTYVDRNKLNINLNNISITK